MKIKNHSVAILALIVCGVWLLYSAKISDSTMPGAPGPKFFPYIIISLLAFLTILNEILSWRRLLQKKKMKTAGSVRGGVSEQEDCAHSPVQSFGEEAADRKKTFLSFVLIFFYIAGIDVIGFYPAAVLALFLALKGIMRINWLKSLSGTAIISGSVFIIFSLVFQLPLPRGIF
ncbi:MAG: tripartite tricarboxylate transporter TctB family protein [Spirochaetales bacterium]|jgi:hypothetical protein|nr:tripartite tricarboxylate transporter TctB family protein [Spirochaetales bacterium]